MKKDKKNKIKVVYMAIHDKSYSIKGFNGEQSINIYRKKVSENHGN